MSDGSRRTYERATALTFLRGCVQDNPCWPECFDAAKSTITEGRMDEWERNGIGAVMAELYGPTPPREPTRHEEADALFAMKILPAPADPQEAT